ncbi:MAG: hypothetical protein ACR2N3_13190 [Pyrinomonadaceae bacterium]
MHKISLSKLFMMFEEGEEITTEIIKSRIKKMIEDENARQPLTDDEIIKLFRVNGIRMSQRVVAKYREQMRIPDSPERKKIM